jgi:hypothetical protein
MDPINQQNTSQLTNRVCLSTFQKHWAEAQIDGPLQLVARYDDVAKLLITIGGFLLGVMASSYSTMLRDRMIIDIAQAKEKSLLVFSMMLIFFLSAALVCFFQPKMRALEILTVKDDKEIEEHMRRWCTELRRTVLRKKICLFISTLAFIASFLTMISLLLLTF